MTTNSHQSASPSFWKAFGPGLLFAGAAIGVSHLVQSTRAGAVYGLGMLVFIIAANAVKYPAFWFGPLYGAATGTSLLEGYRRQGRFALIVYTILTVLTMCTVQSAVTVVTAGLAKTTFGIELSAVAVSALLLCGCALLLGVGQFRWLDRFIKAAVAVLTVSTIVAMAMSVGRLSSDSVQVLPPNFDRATILFIAALAGWMPCPIDISVWHSLWTLARKRDSEHEPTVRESRLDFNIGFFGTGMLAFCFVLLGASVMHGSGQVFADSAAGFAAQVIDLYTATLGEWSRVLMSVCAFSVMLSTTLTVLDGFSRALAVLWDRYHGEEIPSVEAARPAVGKRPAYWVGLVAIALGSLAILQWYLSGLKGLIDLATTISFLTAPVLAVLNHRAVFGTDLPEKHRPSNAMRKFSLVCIGILTLLACGWIWVWFSLKAG